jgi:hypothetical protein
LGDWEIVRLGERQPGDGETDWGWEDAMMSNESKYNRKYVKIYMYSNDCRMGEESGGCSDSERGRSHKA